jgi:DNA-binding PucR family transcriptional regulator
LLASFHRSNRATILHWAESNLRDPGGQVPPFMGQELMSLARDLVRRGLDERALEPFRAGQNAAWLAWMEVAFSLTGDVDQLHELLDVSARSIFAFVDATIAATEEQIESEREELTRGTTAERLETVTLVLEGAPLDLAHTSARLGYAFDRTHVGAIVWSDAEEVEPAALERGARQLAAAAGATRALTVQASSNAYWAWVVPRDGVDADALASALEELPGVRISLGAPASGVEGFRRSHAGAFAAQRLVARWRSPLAVARYEEMKVVSLITHEEERARSFVEETLGELADGPTVLQRTLRTYLRLQSNATRTADALYAHRNTVVARLAKAEELLPRPLGESAFDVSVALEILHWQAGADPLGG